MDPTEIEDIIEQRGAQTVVDALRPYLTDARAARIEQVLAARVEGVTVAIESPADVHNAAAVVRTAEAFGLTSVHVVSPEHGALSKRATTQGAHHWVQTWEHQDLDALLDALGGRYALAGAWPDAPSTLEALPLERPICLLFGNEQRGLSAAAREACTLGFRVPMVGMTESLNLSVCAAVSLYATLTRKRAQGSASDLSPQTRDHLRARYYIHSVDPRLARRVTPSGVSRET
jgi:tRNA (guanosine-2'-O-)-methyltransferase